MNETIEAKPIEILLVENNPVDIRMTKEAFKDFRVATNLHVVTDGDAAMDFIYQRGEYTDAPPDLILLDLGLPKKRGGEILKEVKADPQLRSIPIVVIATSDLDEDVVTSYCHNANAFITKPVDFDAFIAMMRSIGDFWLTFVTLPHQHASH
ncbi:MAG: response regulator [Euryarchaeota archaeon]|nr:response regulator [Euryarchaeota archaeon]